MNVYSAFSKTTYVNLPSSFDILTALLFDTKMTTNSNIRRLNSQLFVNGANSTAPETDKFSSINKLFSTIQINLPDVSFSTNGIDIDISELKCSNLYVDDIQVVSNDRSMDVDVSGIKN